MLGEHWDVFGQEEEVLSMDRHLWEAMARIRGIQEKQK